MSGGVPNRKRAQRLKDGRLVINVLKIVFIEGWIERTNRPPYSFKALQGSKPKEA